MNISKQETIVIVPHGVCSKMMEVDVSDYMAIMEIRITGGCEGQGKTLNKLLKGVHIRTAVEELLGITCGRRGTSCADQLSKGLYKWLEEHPEHCVLNCDNCPEDKFDKCEQKFTRKIE